MRMVRTRVKASSLSLEYGVRTRSRQSNSCLSIGVPRSCKRSNVIALLLVTGSGPTKRGDDVDSRRALRIRHRYGPRQRSFIDRALGERARRGTVEHLPVDVVSRAVTRTIPASL